MTVIARVGSSTGCVESKLLCTVIPPTKLTIETVDIIFSVLAIRLIREYTERVERGVSIPPQLEPLYRAYALHLSKTVCASMDIGPDNVGIEEIDQVLPAQIPLELDRAFNSRKFVSDRDVLVMYTNTFISSVSNSVRFLKRQVSFHVGGVVVWAMARVQRMWMYIRGDI
jgi:hypothetical protein